MNLRWQDHLSVKGRERIKSDSQQLAKYFRRKLLEAYKQRDDLNLEILTSPTAASLQVELALVEISPTKAWLNASGTIAGFFVPGVGTISGILASGSVAFEGRLRLHGKVIAKFKDHEADQITPIGVQNFTWYSHTHKTLDSWASQLAELAATRHKMAQVDDSSPFDLRPW